MLLKREERLQGEHHNDTPTGFRAKERVDKDKSYNQRYLR